MQSEQNNQEVKIFFTVLLLTFIVLICYFHSLSSPKTNWKLSHLYHKPSRRNIFYGLLQFVWILFGWSTSPSSSSIFLFFCQFFFRFETLIRTLTATFFLDLNHHGLYLNTFADHRTRKFNHRAGKPTASFLCCLL